MANKMKYISHLAEETAHDMVKNDTAWKQYLQTAARLYKYPFQEQMLIYAQRPDATACASIEIWNKTMNCWVNKGAKGIALIDEEAPYPRLKYVFDISNVHKARQIGKDPYLWKLREEHQESVLKRLERIYGETTPEDSFPNRILQLAEQIATDSIDEMVADLEYLTEGSFLEGLDSYSLKVRLRDTLQASMAYTLLTRCGIDADLYQESFDFAFIREFNTMATVSQLGTSTTELCKPVLMEIGKAIHTFDRELAKKEVANVSEVRYNALKRKSEGDNQVKQETNVNQESNKDQLKNLHQERGIQDGIDISSERRLLHPEHSDGRAATGGTDQIRDDAQEIPTRTQEGDVFGDALIRQTNESSARDSGESRGTDGATNRRDGKEPDGERGTKGESAHGMGGTDESNSPVGRGEHLDRADLSVAPPVTPQVPTPVVQEESHSDTLESGSQQLPDFLQLSLFPSVEEQVGNMLLDHADDWKPLPMSNLISEEMITHALVTGGGQEHSRERIFAKFQKGTQAEQMAEFLKQEYGIGGKGFTSEEKAFAIWYDKDGVGVSIGNAARFQPMVTLSWIEVAERTQELITAGQYMTEAEMWMVPILEKKELSSKIYFFFRDEYGQIPEELLENGYNYPKANEEFIEKLSSKDGIGQILHHMNKAMEEIEQGEVTPRFHSRYEAKEIREAVVELEIEPLSFPSVTSLTIPMETFITQDEIDYRLCGGSGVSQGLYRIYEHFLEHMNKKDHVTFLKSEYGIGGSSPGVVGASHSYENHDAKGLFLSKGGILAPHVKILLTWSNVAERIRTLIDTNRFLSPEGKEAHQKWKEERAQQAFEQAKEKLEIDEPVLEAEELEPEELEPEELALEEPEVVEPFLPVREDIQEPRETQTEVQPLNFRLPEADGIKRSPKEQFQQNVAAIRILSTIEGEERAATPEEQVSLAKYIGWGGLADAFDERSSVWKVEYLELKSLLSPEEYASARESVLSAHYTNPVIIRSMYEVLAQMGFQKGNILEPSMGIGNFFGMLPEQMQASQLYGVELDSLTGRIAKQLYPNADIRIAGFEKTALPDDFFDVAIGNVPFGGYKVSDKKYDKHNFFIHDYFFAKTIDKVRSGGVVAMITSNGSGGGTFDKRDSKARRYIATRCDLLGAIRLPRGAFEHTEVTTDILFFQKLEKQRDLLYDEPDWVQAALIHESDHRKDDGTIVHNTVYTNPYFIDHPEMVLGKQEIISGPYGPQLVTSSTEGDLERKLMAATRQISGVIEGSGLDELEDDTDKITILADPSVRNYSYAMIKEDVYYRENSVMKPVELSEQMKERIKGMVTLRNLTNEVITYQLEEYGVDAIKAKQEELSSSYDTFTKAYGLIHSRTNKRAFSQDSSYCLLCSLEILKEDGTLERKADMFTKRTIKKQEVVTSVDTASEALAVSMSEKACVDIGYMVSLLNNDKQPEEIITELRGVIFKNPMSNLDEPYTGWETSDAYLSGNVREKLEIATLCAKTRPEYGIHVQALSQVQPKQLDASDIEVRLGANWVDQGYLNTFMEEVFETPKEKLERNVITTRYLDITGQWNIKGKNADYGNPLTEMTYGTGRANAYKILEDSLNLRDSRVYDTVYEDGKEKRVINKKETTLASQKQEAIREAFKDWIFRDGQRREVLCEQYNRIFNSNRPREYDGTHLTFPGMTPDIALRPHQKHAVAHQLYGENCLLSHCVGAGKTFEMVAAAMESKRLGLAQKSLFVVPNHLTEQWASDFLRLYSGANILAATKRDFEPANRKKFCSRIAMGDYDAVIIGHSQFEKVPLSRARQEAIMDRQIQDIEMAIETTKAEQGERYTIKQMEKTKKSLQVRLDRLNDDSRKDDVVTFEQLGVDRLFVDESHGFKNLFLHTKMRNVAGIAQTEAQKSSDMFAKCQYMDELTGGKGITFATGTPISNSMTELYTTMRYLQYGTLQRLGLGHFDSWAAAFGETVTAIELAPEGTGYRAKTRFARFFNLPELLALFKECADIQTPDMLKLPVPEAIYEDVVLKPSEHQKEMVKSLAERAEAVRNRQVDSAVDNMLKITNDGRKLALDQRLVNQLLPDTLASKTSKCVEKAVDIWKESKEEKSAQLIFCDLSTPKKDGTFNVYHDTRAKLIENGVPQEEIAFIHDANTEARKTELFAKVRSGRVRFLLGSTAKMGAGTNVQDRLIAEHHLDVPWRPSDIEQREGRIIRQGNQNKSVKIFRYITEGTFDAYSWQIIENKQKFISQIMTSKSPVRSCEDIDEASLSYAEVKALATGNPYIKEKMDLDIQVSKLKLLKANHTSQIYRLEDNIAKHYPQKISKTMEQIKGYEADIAQYQQVKPVDKEVFAMTVGNRLCTDKKEAGTFLLALCKQVKTPNAVTPVGEYLGFQMHVTYESFYQKFTLQLKNALTHSVEIGGDALGNLTRVNNTLEAMSQQLLQKQEVLHNTQKQLESAKEEVEKPFPQEEGLNEKLERLAELNALLNMDEKGSEECLEEPEGGRGVEEQKVSNARPSIMEKLVVFKEQSSKASIEPMKQRDNVEVL